MPKPRVLPDDRLLNLASAMLLSAISSRAVIPTGDAIRQVVREARTFLSEVDQPTQPKAKPTQVDRGGPDAEFDEDSSW